MGTDIQLRSVWQHHQDRQQFVDAGIQLRNGNMVELGGGAPTQYLYDETGGGALADSQAQGYAFAQIPLPGGAMANYSGGALSTYLHADWLGSIRFVSTPGRGMYSDLARAPFGEEYALKGAPYEPFAGMLQQLQGDLFDTHYREYHPTQGRWITPDPAGLAAVDPSNPQTWNRYAYVLNNPLSNTDPTGMDGCQNGADGSDYDCSVSTNNESSGSSGAGDQPWWSGGVLNLGAIPAGYSGPLGGGYYWSNGYLGFLSSSATSSSATSSSGTSSSGTSSLATKSTAASSRTTGGSSRVRAVGTAIGNAWLTATTPISHTADWVENHPLITFPMAILALLDGKSGPIQEDEEILEEGLPAVEEGVKSAVTSFFDNTRYTNDVLGQMEQGTGEFHSFPEIVRNYESSGTVSNIIGRDGQTRQMLQIPGSYGVYNGNFTFIKEVTVKSTTDFSKN